MATAPATIPNALTNNTTATTHVSIPNAPVNNAMATAPANNTAAGSDAIEIENWQSIQNSNDSADFQAYLHRFANGHFAELARNRLAKLSAPKDVCQAIVGTWSWWINGDVTFYADGTLMPESSNSRGSWSCKNGLVTIIWSNGVVDTVTLSNDGKHVTGHGLLSLLVSGDKK
jgi:hypothetical protein